MEIGEHQACGHCSLGLYCIHHHKPSQRYAKLPKKQQFEKAPPCKTRPGLKCQGALDIARYVKPKHPSDMAWEHPGDGNFETVTLWVDSGANIHSKNEVEIPAEDFPYSKEEWEEMSEVEKKDFVLMHFHNYEWGTDFQ